MKAPLETYPYFQYLDRCLRYQYAQMKQMQDALQRLSLQVEELSRKAAVPQTIHNEYKFDLLKVETLEGTLNIGIRPSGDNGPSGPNGQNDQNGDSAIEEFAVGQSLQVPGLLEKRYPQLSRTISAGVGAYLDQEANQTLERLAQQHHVPLHGAHRQFLVDDVKKQVDRRISHYLAHYGSEEMTREEAEQLSDKIIRQVKQDVDDTFALYFQSTAKEQRP